MNPPLMLGKVLAEKNVNNHGKEDFQPSIKRQFFLYLSSNKRRNFDLYAGVFLIMFDSASIV